MALVFFLVIILSRLLFEPVANAIETRREIAEGAERFRKETGERVESALSEWRGATGRVRAEGHRELDRVRQETLAERSRILETERDRALAEMTAARETVRKEGDAALRALEGEADRLASEIASRLLERQVA